MSKTYNRVTLVGRLGKDPECKVLSPESMITELRIATNHWDGKAKAEVATWHSVKVVGKRAEKVAEWCHKGDLVLVEGEIREESWTDKASGEPRRKTVVLAFDATNLSGKGAQAGGASDEDMPW
jgi:single-strand DNA-binding protein